jgi:hypothetical protein
MAHILSNTPGRLRLRLKPEHRSKQFMSRIQTHLVAQDGVDRVRLNPDTGSVTIAYDPAQRKAGDLLATLHEFAGLVTSIGGGEEFSLSTDGTSTTALGIVGVLGDFDRRLSGMTGRALDLKLLFPAALGAVGLYKLLLNGLEFEQVPAYVLLWYAFDSFYKLHRMPGLPSAHLPPVAEPAAEPAPITGGQAVLHG